MSITYVVRHLSFRLLDRFLPTPIAIFVALSPAAGIFAGLHGLRSTGFYIAAFVVVMTGLVYYQQYLPDSFREVVPLSVALIFGIYRAINIQNGGGYLTFVSDMLQAQPPLLWANGLAPFIEAVTLVTAVWFAGKLALRVGGMVADII